jgi:diguanylate cyclase (GGDEF)-like protein
MIPPAPEKSPPLGLPAVSAAPLLDRGVGGGAVSVHRLLLDLIPMRGGEEMERVVLAVLRAVTGSSWGALLRGVPGESFVCRVAHGTGPGQALTVPASALPPLPAGTTLVDVPPGSALRSHLPAGFGVLALMELDGGERVLFAGGGDADARAEDDPAASTIIDIVLQGAEAALRNATRLDRLRSAALLDPLTGCFNRRGLDEHLRVELSRARRYGRSLSLLIIDLDHFKQVNDDLGHDAGDFVLRDMGGILLRTFRATDRVCRFGGDEFAVVFPETDRANVIELAERLRHEVERHFVGTRVARGLTASFGVAAYPVDAEDPEALLRAADAALYRAKGSGRNRVEAA